MSAPVTAARSVRLPRPRRTSGRGRRADRRRPRGACTQVVGRYRTGRPKARAMDFGRRRRRERHPPGTDRPAGSREGDRPRHRDLGAGVERKRLVVAGVTAWRPVAIALGMRRAARTGSRASAPPAAGAGLVTSTTPASGIKSCLIAPA